MELSIADIRELRYEDGPGIRTTIFFQGCNRRCAGCHNPDTWDIDKGEKISVDEVIKRVLDKKTPYKRVTISGGEPLLQRDALGELIFKLFNLGYDIGLYTSYEIEEIPKEYLKYLSFIKTGEFKEDLKIENRYYGSANQKIIYLDKGRVVYES